VLRGERYGLPADVYSYGVCRIVHAVRAGAFPRFNDHRCASGSCSHVVCPGKAWPRFRSHHEFDLRSECCIYASRWVTRRAFRSAQVILGVSSGSRLPIPNDAPPIVRQLMTRCFAEDPAARPTMQYVVDSLQSAVAPPPPVLPPGARPTDGGTRGQKRAPKKKGSDAENTEQIEASLLHDSDDYL